MKFLIKCNSLNKGLSSHFEYANKMYVSNEASAFFSSGGMDGVQIALSSL